MIGFVEISGRASVGAGWLRGKSLLVHVQADIPFGKAVVGMFPVFKSGFMALLASLGACVLRMDYIVRDVDWLLFCGGGFRLGGA